MITPVVQRWSAHRDVYRPVGEPIDPRRHEVAEIEGDALAKDFVLRTHYSRSYPSARFRFGLWRVGRLVGVAVFSHPANDAVLRVLPGERLEGVELGRFVLLDEVPSNGETWFLGRCFELLRGHGVTGVVSFSDPVPRTDTDGRLVFPGHIGTIYQAANAAYTGRSRAERRRLLPDGTVLHNRALAKIRGREPGWEYAQRLLVAHGADALGDSEDVEAWLARWLPRLTRPLAHGGNHRYLWGLTRASRRALLRRLADEGRLAAYPKWVPPATLRPAVAAV